MALSRGGLLFALVVGCDALRRGKRDKSASTSSLLVPISTAQPDTTLFPPKRRSPLEPVNTEVAGPKHTNKFWGNWVVNDGNQAFSIFPSPYTLRWRQEGSSSSGSMYVMKGETDYQGTFFTTHWFPDFIMGAVEGFSGTHTVIREDHFGIHAQVRGSSCTMTYPVYAGMAYVTARYEGSCTPKITSDYGVTVTKVKRAVFEFRSSRKAYRVYALASGGQWAANSYNFNADGTLNAPLDGWVRLADVQQESDVTVLDQRSRRILTGMDLAITEGTVQYNFEAVGPGSLLHWAYANHMHFLSGGASLESGLTQTRSPVKGLMFPLVGNTWTMSVDLTDALAVSFLPAEQPPVEKKAEIRAAARVDYQWFTQYWRNAMHKRDHYFSGKGFQKLAQVCHILKNYNDIRTDGCAAILKEAFTCMYQRTVSDGSDRRLAGPDGSWQQEVGCWWSPFGTWYDEDWGGIPSRWDDSPICGLDFGNSCYNDHHYHWGYYVVAGAMLLDLDPTMKNDAKFVDFINMFIRDAANPSKDDPYFPQFRAFDWFDMHSWSRGLKPDPSGKDQESTSEEVNLHFGMVLWGKMIGNDVMTKMAATSLTCASRALQDYFLMKRDNPNHPASFSINHVTGIFFQNKVHITTWFGQDPRYIHGIQMLPLSAGLQLSRKDDFAFEEWTDSLASIPIDITDPWWSILLTGNLAMWNPDEAWSYLTQMQPENFDDGLMKSWALYWTSIQKADGPRPTPAPVATPAPGAPTPPMAIMCNPNLNQMCPGEIPCPQCGSNACACP